VQILVVKSHSTTRVTTCKNGKPAGGNPKRLATEASKPAEKFFSEGSVARKRGMG
jgi:hypothetical protein